MPEGINKEEVVGENLKSVVENVGQQNVEDLEKNVGVTVGTSVVGSLIKNEEIKNKGVEFEEVANEASDQINILKQKIEQELADIDPESKKASISALEFFNGDEKTMKEHFIKIGTEYVVGVPIEKSAVRMELQNRILTELKPGTPLVIEAYSRQGKTSMLKSVGNEWEEKNKEKAIFIDPMKTEYKWSTQSNEEFLNDFGKREVGYYLEDYLPNVSSEEMNGKNPFAFLDEQLQKEGKEVMLQIDETTRFSGNDGEKLKALTENLKNLKNVKVILAWHPFDNLSEISNGAFKDCERIPIKPLTISDVKTLIEKPIKNIGSEITFSDEALEKILDYTGGRPIDVNIFCKNLFGADGKNPLYKIKYEGKDIEEFINTNPEKDVFTITRQGVFPDVIKLLNNEHREIISNMVKNDGKIELSRILPKEADELVNLGLIRKNEESNSFQINGELVINLMKELGV